LIILYLPTDDQNGEAGAAFPLAERRRAARVTIRRVC
jgi:hypothetical protein